MSLSYNKIELSVIVTALNEEKNISATINSVLRSFDDYKINGEAIIINDGSTDGSEDLVKSLMGKDARIKLISHPKPKGVGASFWEGVDKAEGMAAMWMPGDNENNPWEIFRYYKLLDHVDMVIPFIFNKEARSLFRNALSYLYRLIINTTFMVNFNYTNGTIIYRKSLLRELDYRSNGFFFQTDILIRTAKKGYLFAEVPYRLGMRKEGVSKAITFPSLKNVTKGYLKLVKDHYFKKDSKIPFHYAEDSITAIRRDKRNGR